jgi:hypothetical protein
MKLLLKAAPGVETHADRVVVSACHLADTVTSATWSAGALEDALDALDTLVGSVSEIGPELAQALAVVAAATTDACLILGLTELPAPATVPAQPVRAGDRRTRRRGLGPGYRGLATRPED